MENHHENEAQAQASGTPSTEPARTDDNDNDNNNNNNNTVPTSNIHTHIHILEFHHEGCPSCDTSFPDTTPIFASPGGADYYQELTNTMLSKAYDVMDIFHAGDGLVIQDIRLSAMWGQAQRFTDMDSLDPEERESLLDFLKGSRDSYRLRVGFTTFPLQTDEIREALHPGATGTADDGHVGPVVEVDN